MPQDKLLSENTKNNIIFIMMTGMTGKGIVVKHGVEDVDVMIICTAIPQVVFDNFMTI